MTTLSVIIPCYNEKDSVEQLRQQLLPVLHNLQGKQIGGTQEALTQIEVILVDDGSKDGTSEALQAVFSGLQSPELQFRFLKHPQNMGLGAALRTGFSAAQGDFVVTTDSDGTYRFESIPALLDTLVPGIDIVTASPYHPKGRVENVPGYRIFLSRGSSMLYRVLVNWHIYCYTALFRVYRKEIVKNFAFESNGFLAGTELMVTAMLAGHKVAEYPAVLHSRAFGASKAKIMRTIRAHLHFQWEILLYRMGMGSWKAIEHVKGLEQ
jgi:dolichol-phosphate mannosyltransferase